MCLCVTEGETIKKRKCKKSIKNKLNKIKNILKIVAVKKRTLKLKPRL